MRPQTMTGFTARARSRKPVRSRFFRISCARMPKGPIVQGSLVAVTAAILFGLTTPLVKHFGANVGAFATAALLYAGAALGSSFRRASRDELGVTSRELPRVVVVAVLGAVLAPAAFAWGLQRAGALASSL